MTKPIISLLFIFSFSIFAQYGGQIHCGSVETINYLQGSKNLRVVFSNHTICYADRPCDLSYIDSKDEMMTIISKNDVISLENEAYLCTDYNQLVFSDSKESALSELLNN